MTAHYRRSVGFSWIGLVFSLADGDPSLLLVLFPPRDPPSSALAPVPRSLTVLERIGQASCLVIPPLSTSLQRRIDLWLVLAAACYCIYLGLWGRYVLRGRRRVMLLRSWARIPIPLAVFPVLTFAFAAVWARSPWLAGATVILAAGHLPATWITAKQQLAESARAEE